MPFTYTSVSSKYGAPMGRQNVLPDGPTKLHLERVRMVDGDYDPGGAYWGGGQPLYVAWDENGTQIFVRADYREAAKQEVLDLVSDDVTFHRVPADSRFEWWTSSSGFVELQITKDQAAACAHPGPADSDVEQLSHMPTIRSQLDEIDPDDLRRELKGYGAWSETELADHEQNLQRVLWIACGDIHEGNN